VSVANVHIEGSNIDGDITIKGNKTVHDLIDEVVEELDRDVEESEISEIDVRQLYAIKDELKTCDEPFLNNVVLYISGLVSHHDKHAKLRAFIVFILNCRALDASAKITTEKNSAIVSDTPHWLFNLARNDDEYLALHLSKLLKFLKKTPPGYAKDGVAFLAKLKKTGGLDCATCIGSVATDSVDGLLIDWMTGQKDGFGGSEVKDIFEIKEDRNLIIKCGNCVSDIYEGDKAKTVLEGHK
jgi:hypothetical protein